MGRTLDRGLLAMGSRSAKPALIDVLAERTDLIDSALLANGNRKKAVVPVCGMGYDVLLLSSFGYDVCGLELSDNALKGARRVEEESVGEEYLAKDPRVGKGKVKFLSGDFFKDDFLGGVEGEGKFDVIYDYTVRSLFLEKMGAAYKVTVSFCSPAISQTCVGFEVLPNSSSIWEIDMS
jgi:methyl halide transferase